MLRFRCGYWRWVCDLFLKHFCFCNLLKPSPCPDSINEKSRLKMKRKKLLCGPRRSVMNTTNHFITGVLIRRDIQRWSRDDRGQWASHREVVFNQLSGSDRSCVSTRHIHLYCLCNKHDTVQPAVSSFSSHWDKGKQRAWLSLETKSAYQHRRNCNMLCLEHLICSNTKG